MESTQDMTSVQSPTPSADYNTNIFGGDSLNCMLDTTSFGAPINKGLDAVCCQPAEDVFTSWTDEFFSDPELDKLLHPFAGGNTNTSNDNIWDIESLLTAQ